MLGMNEVQNDSINYAFVGTDGVNLVVWAFGENVNDAVDDLNEQDDVPDECELIAVSPAAAALLRCGEVRCDSGSDRLRVVDFSGQPARNQHTGAFSAERAGILVAADEDAYAAAKSKS
jgi:hypothetical protein